MFIKISGERVGRIDFYNFYVLFTFLLKDFHSFFLSGPVATQM